MLPKDKAQEIYNSFTLGSFRKLNWETVEFEIIPNNKNAKECALIMVNELIKLTNDPYWEQVKHELITL